MVTSRRPPPPAPGELRFNLPPDLVQKQPGVSLEQQSVNALSRLAPPTLSFLLFPGDGDYGLIAPGTTTIDFVNQIVVGPSGSQTQFVVDQSLLAMVQSLFISVDSPVQVKILPSAQLFPVVPGAVLNAPYVKVTALQIITDVPCLVSVALSTGLTVAGVYPVSLVQRRYGDVTITKGVASGSTEGLANTAQALGFTARTETKQFPTPIPTATYIRTMGVGQKIFVVRNIGPGAVDVQLFGTTLLSTPTTVATARANTDGWVADPDQLTSTGGTPTNIASGADAVIESGVGWHLVQLRARVAKGEVQGQAARLITEYAGTLPAMR